MVYTVLSNINPDIKVTFTEGNKLKFSCENYENILTLFNIHCLS